MITRIDLINIDIDMQTDGREARWLGNNNIDGGNNNNIDKIDRERGIGREQPTTPLSPQPASIHPPSPPLPSPNPNPSSNGRLSPLTFKALAHIGATEKDIDDITQLNQAVEREVET